MTPSLRSLERKANHRCQGPIRRIARGASRLGVSLVLLGFVASCMMPGPFPQGPYQQGQYEGSAGTSPGAGAAMRVVYQRPTEKPEREAIRSFLQENKTFDRYASGLTKMFRFPQAVNVVWTECGSANASWDGRGNLLMCYEMAELLKSLFSKRVKDRKQLAVAVMSSLMFVFLHELGHGLIAMYDLPSRGREEDAADQLAGLVLIAAGDSGLEIATRGAQFFRLLSLPSSKIPFSDEHALDAQRYYNLLCLVYGSNPDRLESLVGRDKLPASRARRCPREYSKVATAWGSLLDPHLQKSRYAGLPSGNRTIPARTSRGSSGHSDDSGYWDDSGYSNDSGDSGYSDDSSYDSGGSGYDSGGSGYDSGDSGYPRNAGRSRNPRSRSGAGQWQCRAVGTYVRGGSDGSPDYSDPQNVDVTKWGNTRDEAGGEALNTCSGMVSISSNSTIYPGSLVTQYCEVIQCSQR